MELTSDDYMEVLDYLRMQVQRSDLRLLDEYVMADFTVEDNGRARLMIYMQHFIERSKRLQSNRYKKTLELLNNSVVTKDGPITQIVVQFDEVDQIEYGFKEIDLGDFDQRLADEVHRLVPQLEELYQQIFGSRHD